MTKARFTADSNPVVNINAGLKGDNFFLVTGGDVTNTDTPLGKPLERKQAKSPETKLDQELDELLKPLAASR